MLTNAKSVTSVAACAQLPFGAPRGAKPLPLRTAFSTTENLVVIGDDESLAQEVRALGGFDALVRPLRDSDVLWTIASAWHAWMKRREYGGNGVP